MKSIAFYYESSEATGGVNRVASVIASALAERGYCVHIISRYEGKRGRFTDNPNIVFHQLFRRLHSKYLTAPVEAIRLRRLVKRARIDILVSAGGIFFALAQFSSVTHVEWDHVSFWHGNPLQQYCRRLAARKAAAVVTLTEDNRSAFARIRRVKAEILTIHNPAMFQPEKNADPAKRVIISLGFLARQKGYDLLLEAWSRITPELRREWILQIAGDDEGDLQILEAMIHEKRLHEVHLLGFRRDVPELLAGSSIYVMSSRWEGMPMVLLEAQSCGLPVISFDCKTGPAEIVTPDSGILVEAENVEQLAVALCRLMEDESLRCSMSAAALENVKRFALDKIIWRWTELLERL